MSYELGVMGNMKLEIGNGKWEMGNGKWEVQ